VVALLGWGFFGWQVRRSIENALRKLNTDYLITSNRVGWGWATQIASNYALHPQIRPVLSLIATIFIPKDI
jgi:hypothetical protein